MASSTLLDGLQRMVRYARIANTVVKPEIIIEGNRVRVVRHVDAVPEDAAARPPYEAVPPHHPPRHPPILTRSPSLVEPGRAPQLAVP